MCIFCIFTKFNFKIQIFCILSALLHLESALKCKCTFSKSPDDPSRRHEGLLHVINMETEEDLHLNSINGGVILDLKFAFIFERIILAAVDELGNLLVVEIFESRDSFKTLSYRKIVELSHSVAKTNPTR